MPESVIEGKSDPPPKNSLNSLESWIQTFKLLFYVSLTLGIIWNLLYFGFVINALPDFDASTIIGYIISVFGIGLIVVFSLVIAFILPGISLFLISKNDKNIGNWLNESWKKLKIKNSLMLFLIPISLNIVSTLILVWLTWNNAKYPTIILTIPFILPLLITLIWLVYEAIKNKPKDKRISWGILGLIWYVFMFWSIPVVIGFLFMAMSLKNSGWWWGLLTYFVMISSGGVLNALIASKGFDFLEKPADSILRNILGFLLVVFIILVIFFGLPLISNSRNQLFILPFQKLKIGFIDADLTLDEEYVRKSQFINKKYSHDEQCETTFKFKILSNIGTEYIVEYPAESAKDKSAIGKRILRIPKSQVLLIEYTENKNEKNKD